MKRLAPFLLLALAACAQPTTPALEAQLCPQTDPAERGRCLDDIVTKAKVFDDCARLPASERRAECEKRRAIEAESAAQCQRVIFAAARAACLVTVAVELDDPSLCAAITLPRPARHCRINLAKKRRDPDLCNEISTAFERAQCVARVARESNPIDDTLCAAIAHPRVRRACRHGGQNQPR